LIAPTSPEQEYFSPHELSCWAIIIIPTKWLGSETLAHHLQQEATPQRNIAKTMRDMTAVVATNPAPTVGGVALAALQM
jgi:hypothetical protein